MGILYIHGFNSGPSTSSGKKLAECFLDVPVRVLSYDSALTFPEIYAQLENEIRKERRNGPLLLAGGSLGGHYAARLAEALGLPALLVNPCNNPQKSLEMCVGENESFEDGHRWTFSREALESYKPLNSATLPDLPRLVLIGRNDEVLDPDENAAFWKDHAQIVMTDDGHSVESFEPVKDDIMYMLARAACLRPSSD